MPVSPGSVVTAEQGIVRDTGGWGAALRTGTLSECPLKCLFGEVPEVV